MAVRKLEGARIRDIRLRKSLRQSAVAADCDISPSYLNLIEHNRRPVAGALLGRIARALDVDATEISDGVEAGLVSTLDAVAGRKETADITLEPSEDLATRFPAWAQVVARQAEQIEQLESLVETLSDRLARDPYLSASLHNVLSTVTSIRSTSAILTSGDEIAPEWQARFHRNMYEDSQRLADATDGLVTYLDRDGDRDSQGGLPQDEVNTWLEEVSWRPGQAELPAKGTVSEAARQIIKRLSDRARTDAEALPDDLLLGAMRGDTLDPIRLASDLKCAPDHVMRRLAALPDGALPAGQVPGIVMCDGSGTFTFRRPVRGFEPPRSGDACSLWPLFEAIQRPLVPVRRRIVLRGRDTTAFEAIAYGSTTHPMGFEHPPAVEATMIVIPTEGDTGLPVGMTCRVCTEVSCPVRREASMFQG